MDVILAKKKVAFSSHINFGTTGQDYNGIRQYLIHYNKAGKLLWITHPFKYHPQQRGSGFEIYEQGQLTKNFFNSLKQISDKPSEKPYSILRYFKDIYLNIWYVIKSKEVYDCYIGYGFLHGGCGWLLKKIGRTKYSIYLASDFTPKLFNSKLLNGIYHMLDTFCVKHCDETWNMSAKMIEARQQFTGLDLSKFSKQKVVPVGIWSDDIKYLTFDAIHKNRIVYMGSLIKQQGIQYILKAIPLIIERIPDFQFLVIGSGQYLAQLQELVKDLSIESYVEFTGRIEDHDAMMNLIASSALAVAPYEEGDYEGNWTYSSDSGKIKTYISCSAPILVSNVPYNAVDIERAECGKIIDLQPENIAKVVFEFLLDEEKLKRYRENTVRYAEQFDNIKIYGNAFGDC